MLASDTRYTHRSTRPRRGSLSSHDHDSEPRLRILAITSAISSGVTMVFGIFGCDAVLASETSRSMKKLMGPSESLVEPRLTDRMISTDAMLAVTLFRVRLQHLTYYSRKPTQFA